MHMRRWAGFLRPHWVAFGRLMIQGSTYSVAMTHKKIWVDRTEDYLLHRLALHSPASRISSESPVYLLRGRRSCIHPLGVGLVSSYNSRPSADSKERNGVQERRGIEGWGIV